MAVHVPYNRDFEVPYGVLEDVAAEEAVVVEEVRAALGPAVLAAPARLAVDEGQRELVHVVVPEDGDSLKFHERTMYLKDTTLPRTLTLMDHSFRM